ncbi:MAG: NAD(P)-binding domain-containing protein, partial [Desulfofustis sp.]
AKMKSDAVHIELSTIDPQTSLKCSEAAAAKGIGFLQCTLGKTPAHAEKAEEPLFIGGDKALYEQLADIWPIIGSPSYYMGGVEASCAVKLISNMVGMANLAVLAEGMRAGEKAGIEKKVLVELPLWARSGLEGRQTRLRDGPGLGARPEDHGSCPRTV